MAGLRARISELEHELDALISEHNVFRAERERLETALFAAAQALDERREWEDRARAAEQDLSVLRAHLRQTVDTLRDPAQGGPVAYRSTIADHLERILDG